MSAAAVTLPASVTLDKPSQFEGKIDAEALEAWIFQLEQYFALTGFENENAKVRFASILLTGHAAAWLKSQNVDWELAEWEDLATSMHCYFHPAEYHRRARAELRNCTQRSLTNISGYINAFRRAARKAEFTNDDELFDRFVSGLMPQLREKVLMSQADDFEEACVADERAGAVRSLSNNHLKD